MGATSVLQFSALRSGATSAADTVANMSEHATEAEKRVIRYETDASSMYVEGNASKVPTGKTFTLPGDRNPQGFSAGTKTSGIMKSGPVYETQASDAYAFQKYKQSLIKEDVVSNSRVMMTGEKLWDKKAISELTKDGSKLSDWDKLTSKAVYDTPYGSGQYHYYRNRVTGEISDFDAKMKIIKSKDLWANKSKAEYYFVDVDKNFNVLGVRN